ncbi:MAG: hypothetical protein WBK77_01435 [Alphaproteobacteria bacterium]
MSAVVQKNQELRPLFDAESFWKNSPGKISRLFSSYLVNLRKEISLIEPYSSLSIAEKIRDRALEGMGIMAACHTDGVDRALYLAHSLGEYAVVILQDDFSRLDEADGKNIIRSYISELENKALELREEYDPDHYLYTPDWHHSIR